MNIDLSAAVDVYSDWVDACDNVAKDLADEDRGDDANEMRPRGSMAGLDRQAIADGMDDAEADAEYGDDY